MQPVPGQEDDIIINAEKFIEPLELRYRVQIKMLLAFDRSLKQRGKYRGGSRKGFCILETDQTPRAWLGQFDKISLVIIQKEIS